MPTLSEAVQQHTNGHQKGRDVPPEKLYPFVFESTGRTVYIRKVSALLRDEIHRAVRRDPAFPKEPEPPIQEVDYGDDNKVKRPNRQHSVYLELQKEWQAKYLEEVNERLAVVAIHRGVVCDIDDTAVKQMREEMAASGVPLDDYCDHYVYVAFVCVGPTADYRELLKAVFDRSTPPAEAVQAHKDSFRSDVRDEEPVASEPGPDRDGAADQL